MGGKSSILHGGRVEWDDYVEVALFIVIALFVGYMLTVDLTGG
jgi:hypothetical protein